jgi:hypothetical protein
MIWRPTSSRTKRDEIALRQLHSHSLHRICLGEVGGHVLDERAGDLGRQIGRFGFHTNKKAAFKAASG